MLCNDWQSRSGPGEGYVKSRHSPIGSSKPLPWPFGPHISYATGMSDTIGTRMAGAPSLHHTEFAVSSSKNLQLPPNLKAETTTSLKTSRKALP